MEKIDLDEIEASLGYLEDWKNVIAELRLAREVVEAARYIEANLGHWFLNPSGASELKEAMHRQQCAIKKLDEARRG
jgi:hypothetical protein